MLSDKLLHKTQEILTNLTIAKLLLLTLTLAITAIIIDYGYMLYLRSKMPPGPFPWPIIGNTFSLPDTKPWIYFEELSKKYGTPIITFWIGRNPTIWLNDAWTAHALLEKRAQIYASRPRMVVFGELGTGQNNLVTMRILSDTDRDHWRVHRKLMHLGVGIQSVRGYREIQNNESKIVALDLLREPKEYVKHLERYATSVVSIIAFGRRVKRWDDPIITEVIALMQLAADLNVPGRRWPMLLETFPFLARLPRRLWPLLPFFKGLNYRAPPKNGRGGHYFFHSLALEALAQYDSKPPSQKASIPTPYIKTLTSQNHNLPDSEISSLVGNLFGAGSDTSSSTLITFILACCAFPDAMLKAQAELDSVIGPDRSPHWDDGPSLPYINAFVKEVFRWRSVAIIGGQPHSNTVADWYNGWLIPKHSWVQGNVWAIHHHEREFPDPDRFFPDRFLPDHPYHRPFPGEKGYMSFGWGRRVCSGQALAEQGTWITVARLLWGFNIRKWRDAETGREEEVDIFGFTNGLNMRPKAFRCVIVPRTERVRETMVREGEEAERELRWLEGESKYRMSTFYQERRREVKEVPVVDESGVVRVVKVKD
ncbi:cytochrome P450 [Sordaria brevicollis]|uniref:Cytochrome P450 n=1 Tax=Sordaria brevicollis TaxID=83679 RepID=A0AAE0UFL9_SORBR|nr:cytochrome P450 [Sordaria brevicollis]